jgi:hypothetical protein
MGVGVISGLARPAAGGCDHLDFLLTRSRRSDRICGWIVMNESATYMKFTQVGADLFA